MCEPFPKRNEDVMLVARRFFREATANPTIDPTTLALAVDGRRWLRLPRRGAHADGRSLATIEEIYREHAPCFRRVALAIVHDAETAEDVVQEAFASAIVRRASFRGSGDPTAWVWRIVVNAALSRRRRRRLEGLALERTWFAAETGIEPEPVDDRVRLHVTRLPKRQRLALFLHYYADMDYETIGSVLDIAPGTVGKLLHDARATLRRALEGTSDA
jgi:RNA polymerase sigma-70 factor (ECF subfamily)